MMFRFELLSNENIELLPSLFENAFGERREVDDILTKYSRKDVHPNFVSFLAFDIELNELAGFYGVLPAKLKYIGEDYLCGQICDLMTHSNYRRLGLFESMANHAHKYLKNIGFKFVYTFPYDGATSYFGFVNKLDFQEKPMNSFSLRVLTFPFSKKIQSSCLTKFYYYYLKIILFFLFKNPIDYQKTFNNSNDCNQMIHNQFLFNYKSLLSVNNFFLDFKDFQSFMKIDKDGALSIGSLSLKSLRQFNKIINKLKIFCFLGFIRYIHFEVCKTNYLNEFLTKKVDYQNLYTICFLKFDDSIDVNKIAFNFIDIDSY